MAYKTQYCGEGMWKISFTNTDISNVLGKYLDQSEYEFIAKCLNDTFNERFFEEVKDSYNYMVGLREQEQAR